MGRLRGYRIRLVAKELFEYREGDAHYFFGAGWGVKPPVLYVPRAEMWDQVMPEQFRGRREQILERLLRFRETRRHVLEVSDI